MRDVGIERFASDIHRPVTHGLKTRSPRRAAGYPPPEHPFPLEPQRPPAGKSHIINHYASLGESSLTDFKWPTSKGLC